MGKIDPDWLVNANIEVRKLNEVYLQIACEQSTSQELGEFFTFAVPGSEWSPARRRGWDGLLRLFDRRSHKLYVGLLPYLMAFAKERKYSVKLQPNVGVSDEFSVIEATTYIDSLNIHSQGRHLTARDYQIAPFIYGIRDKRMLLVSPTSSGKSFIQYVLFRYLAEVKGCKKGLLIVPTTGLVEQMVGDFRDYSSINKYNVLGNVHKIYEGQAKDTTKVLSVTTWQSIYEQPAEWFKQFDFIIGDEAHLFRAASLTHIMTSLVNASYRIGLTGTLDGSKVHKLTLEGLFGRQRALVTTKQLMDRKEVAQLTVKVLFLRYNQFLSNTIVDRWYLDELDYIMASKARNNFITNLTNSLKGNTLILFRYVEKHGVLLKDLIEASGRRVYFIYGQVPAKERDEIRAVVEKESDAIIVASYGTFQHGVSIKHLHNVILASPSKSRIQVLQSIGRGLRIGDLKDNCTLFDIVDDFSIDGRTNTTLDHFQERFKYYVDEKFDYKLYTIQLKGEEL